MSGVKISLITVCYNAQSTIVRCIQSVVSQGYENLEYIIIDGGSSDKTIQLIQPFANYIDYFLSESDSGIYDAMNKGISAATGDIIGMLNADDFFASDDVLAQVAAVFYESNTDILYGNLDFVDLNATIIRKWRTKAYKNGYFEWGWMPAHPTFYCRKYLFNRFGFYSLDYGTAADYELMLRFIHAQSVKITFLDKVLVNMQLGGLSNNSLTNRIKAWKFDLKAIRNNHLKFPLLVLILKPLRKIGQYF